MKIAIICGIIIGLIWIPFTIISDKWVGKQKDKKKMSLQQKVLLSIWGFIVVAAFFYFMRDMTLSEIKLEAIKTLIWIIVAAIGCVIYGVIVVRKKKKQQQDQTE